MSYTSVDTGDSLNNLFSSLFDFNIVSHNLIESDNVNSFVIWFDKCININKRALFFFIRKNKKLMHKEFLCIGQSYFKEVF